MMKRKFIAPLIALLLCVSMIGVGFAGWVITATTNATATGNFTVYTVSDHRLQFTATASPVIFGKPNNLPSPQSGWLTVEDMLEEDLTPLITLTFTDLDLAKFKGKTITFEIGAINHTGTAISTAVSKAYVELRNQKGDAAWQTVTLTVNPNGTDATASAGNFDASDGTFTFELNNTYFKWGKATNNSNPYNYFNANGVAVDGNYSAPVGVPQGTFAAGIKNGDAALQILQGIDAIKVPNPSQDVTGDTFSTTITCTISR